jgi:hypothetical protein
MRENSNSGWKFWFGLACGIAAGYYLNTEKGRQLRRDTSERVNQWSQDVSERARTGYENFSTKAGEALERSKNYADRTRSTLKDKIHQAANAVENLVDRTEEGYERAADWAANKLHTGDTTTDTGSRIEQGARPERKTNNPDTWSTQG